MIVCEIMVCLFELCVVAYYVLICLRNVRRPGCVVQC